MNLRTGAFTSFRPEAAYRLCCREHRGAKSMLRVRSGSGSDRPIDPHVAVRYRERWFWIERDDESSRQAFVLAQLMMSLTDTGDASKSPL